MTKADAIQTLKAGKTLTHRLFDTDESIRLENSDINWKICFENNLYQDYNEFWSLRADSVWNDGWEIKS